MSMATTPILKANPLLLSLKQKQKKCFYLPLSSSLVRFTKLSASNKCSCSLTNNTQLYNSRLLSLVNNKKSNTEIEIPTLRAGAKIVNEVVDVVYKKILMGIKVSIVTLLLGLGLSLVMFGRCNRVMAASCGRMGGFPSSSSSSSSSWTSSPSSPSSSSSTSSSPSSPFSYNESQLYYSMWLNSKSSVGESTTSSSGSELSNEDPSEDKLLYVFLSLFFVFVFILFGIVLIILVHDTLEKISVHMHRIVQQIYGSPTSVLMIQVATSKGGHFLRRYLNQICESADTSTLNGLSKLFEETLMSCFLYLEYWSSCCSFVCVGKNTQDAREFFKVLSNETRRKSNEETLINVNNMKLKKKKSVRDERPYQFSIGYTMVTILVAVEGVHKLPPINGKGDLEKALKKLLYIKNKIQGVEVLWTPQYDNETLSEKELHENYPFLRPIGDSNL